MKTIKNKMLWFWIANKIDYNGLNNVDYTVRDSVCMVGSLYSYNDIILAINMLQNAGSIETYIYSESPNSAVQDFTEYIQKFLICNYDQYFNNTMCSIITDLLSGNSLSSYDNYSGKCDVTHKAIPEGDDGWLRFPVRYFWVSNE